MEPKSVSVGLSETLSSPSNKRSWADSNNVENGDSYSELELSAKRSRADDVPMPEDFTSSMLDAPASKNEILTDSNAVALPRDGTSTVDGVTYTHDTEITNDRDNEDHLTETVPDKVESIAAVDNEEDAKSPVVDRPGSETQTVAACYLSDEVDVVSKNEVILQDVGQGVNCKTDTLCKETCAVNYSVSKIDDRPCDSENKVVMNSVSKNATVLSTCTEDVPGGSKADDTPILDSLHIAHPLKTTIQKGFNVMSLINSTIVSDSSVDGADCRTHDPLLDAATDVTDIAVAGSNEELAKLLSQNESRLEVKTSSLDTNPLNLTDQPRVYNLSSSSHGIARQLDEQNKHLMPRDINEAFDLSKREVFTARDRVASDQTLGTIDAYKTVAAEDSVNLPMDLSCGSKSDSLPSASQSEVEKSGCENGIAALPAIDADTVRRLQEDLRNEETKLILLRKLRQSQALRRYLPPDKAPMKPTASSFSHHGGPPPLVRGGAVQPTSFKSSTGQGADPASRLMPVQRSLSSAPSQPPPLIMAPRASLLPSTFSSGFSSSFSSTVPTHGLMPSTPTAVANAPRGYGSPSLMPVGYRTPGQLPLPPLIPPTQLNQVTVTQIATTQPIAEQTSAQRQAAAKLALRKQLEKTLLQIPPPKPPPPEMNFIPNASSTEFVSLLGLEEAIKCILDSASRSKEGAVGGVPLTPEGAKYIFSPFLCVQCSTDHTPVWKRDRPGSRSVICERCVSSNQKRALKQEHTNRLKSAFVKALQQEQEIEQSLVVGGGALLGGASMGGASMSGGGLTSGGGAALVRHTPSPYASSQTGAKSASSFGRVPTRGDSSQPALQLQAQQLQQAQLALMRSAAAAAAAAGSQGLNPNLMFQLPTRSAAAGMPTGKSAVDLQRQYLLDLMPRLSQHDTQMLWRT